MATRDMAEEFTELKVALGRIEVSLENLAHKLKNIEQAHLGFITRREFDQSNDAFSDRLDKIEARHEWFTRWLWGAWLAGVASVVGLGKKTGLF